MKKWKIPVTWIWTFFNKHRRAKQWILKDGLTVTKSEFFRG